MSAGDFATARRGLDVDFVRARSAAGVPAGVIAHMLQTSVADVMPFMAPQTPRPAYSSGYVRPPARAATGLRRRPEKPERPFIPPAAMAVVKGVARKHALNVEELIGDGRPRYVAWPRQEVFYGVHALGRYSFPQIAAMFSRDQSTIRHGAVAHADREGLPYPVVQALDREATFPQPCVKAVSGEAVDGLSRCDCPRSSRGVTA